MIKKLGMWDGYAYRKPAVLEAGVTSLEEGSWIKKKTDGKFEVAVADDTKAYMVISSKRTSRDNITPSNIATYYDGNFEIGF